MRRLPGIQPLAMADWLIVDDAYAGQMAERDRLIAGQREAVHAMEERARPVAEELLELVLGVLAQRADFRVAQDEVRRRDGGHVALDRGVPLIVLGRLVQEDFCLLQDVGGVPVMTGAILCFPASWTLAEKMGRPLGPIHGPVPQYDTELGARVDRLFAGLRPGRPLWRANAHFYEDPRLFQPRPEAAPRAKVEGPAPYLRSERQALLRLPETGAVVFSIHTYVIARESLAPEQRATLRDHPIGYDPARLVGPA
ncbi:MAG: heme-dependent oxidative N-demethylase family protein [Rhodovulum sp.]